MVVFKLLPLVLGVSVMVASITLLNYCLLVGVEGHLLE